MSKRRPMGHGNTQERVAAGGGGIDECSGDVWLHTACRCRYRYRSDVDADADALEEG
jgi:hypothetical protein